MNLSDRRVVAFRQWAEDRFCIGSGGYPEGEDLLSVVMAAVDERLGVTRAETDGRRDRLVARTGEDPAWLEYLKKELDG